MSDALDKLLISLGIKEKPPTAGELAWTGLGLASSAYAIPEAAYDTVGMASRRVIGDVMTGTGPTGLSSSTFDPNTGAAVRRGHILPTILAHAAGEDGRTNQHVIMPHQTLEEHLAPGKGQNRLLPGWDIPTKYMPGSDDFSRLHVLREAVEQFPAYVRNNKLQTGLGALGLAVSSAAALSHGADLVDKLEKLSADKLAWGFNESFSDGSSAGDVAAVLGTGAGALGGAGLLSMGVTDALAHGGMSLYSKGDHFDSGSQMQKSFRKFRDVLPQDQREALFDRIVNAGEIGLPKVGPALMPVAEDTPGGRKSWLILDAGSDSGVRRRSVPLLLHEMGHAANREGRIPRAHLASMSRKGKALVVGSAIGAPLLGDEDVRDVAIPLSAATMMPLLAEEGRAWLNADRVRNRILAEPEGLTEATRAALSRFKLRHGLPAYSTYLATAASVPLTALAIGAGVDAAQERQRSKTLSGRLEKLLGLDE